MTNCKNGHEFTSPAYKDSWTGTIVPPKGAGSIYKPTARDNPICPICGVRV